MRTAVDRIEYPTEGSLPDYWTRRRMVPSPFIAVIPIDPGEVELMLEVEIRNGVPEVREVTFRSVGIGRAIRATDIRVKFNDLVEDAVAAAARIRSNTDEWPEMPPEFSTDGSDLDQLAEEAWRNGWFLRRPETEAERVETVREVARARRRTRRKVTDDLLREVAEVYRANDDDRPTVAVRERFDMAQSTAALYVRRARDAGYLGPALVGKAGEKA